MTVTLGGHGAGVLLHGVLGVVDQDVRALGELNEAAVSFGVAFDVRGVNDGFTRVLEFVNNRAAFRMVVSAVLSHDDLVFAGLRNRPASSFGIGSFRQNDMIRAFQGADVFERISLVEI